MTAEIMLFATLLMLESGGEPWAGKAAVADTVVTRKRQSGKSLTEVMLAPRQFSCFNNMKAADKLAASVAEGKHRNDAAWSDCMILATLAARPGYRVKIKASHFYNPSKASPSWAAKMIEVATIGNHRFMIEQRRAK